MKLILVNPTCQVHKQKEKLYTTTCETINKVVTRLYWCGKGYTVCICTVWEMAAVFVNCKGIIMTSLWGNSVCCLYIRVRNLWTTWNASSGGFILVCRASFFRVTTQRKRCVKLYVALLLSKTGTRTSYGCIISTTLYHCPGCTTGKNLYIVSLKRKLAWGSWDLNTWDSVMFPIRHITRCPRTCEWSWFIDVGCVRLLCEFYSWPIHTGDHDTCREGKEGGAPKKIILMSMVLPRKPWLM